MRQVNSFKGIIPQEDRLEILPTIAKDDAQEYMNNLLMDIAGVNTLEQANRILMGLSPDKE